MKFAKISLLINQNKGLVAARRGTLRDVFSKTLQFQQKFWVQTRTFKNEQKERKANVSATYGGPLQCKMDCP